MARSISLKTVKFYRALIEVKTADDEWRPLTVFGPYASRSACVDRDARWSRCAYEEERRRVTRQVQAIVNDQLVWVNADE